MDNTQSRAASLAERLAASMSSSSESKENASSFPSSSFGGSSGSPFSGGFGSNSNGMTSIDNPFYIGNLSSSDQDKLRSAFSNAF